MENEMIGRTEDVVSIALDFATPFLAGVPFREERLLLKKDEVSYTLLRGIASQKNPRRVYSFRVNAPFQNEEDRLKDYAADFLLLCQMILAYHPVSKGPFHPRMSDLGYPHLTLSFQDGKLYEIRDLPLTLNGDPAIEKIVALMQKYQPEGIN